MESLNAVKRKKSEYSGGFSLMEVLVSIFIISIALIGIMSLMSAINSSASVSSSKLIAANLAQEGIEIVKNIRDLNYLADDNGDGEPDYSWNVCYTSLSGEITFLVQYDDTSPRLFSEEPLKYDLTTGLYGYDAGAVTPFAYKRKIIMTKNPSGLDDNEIKVQAVVSWVEHGRAESLTVEDRLWNWR